MKILDKIDSRFFYLLIGLAIMIPVARPIGLPVDVTATTQQTLDEINRIQPGDKVVYLYDISISAAADVYPGVEITFELLMDRGAKAVCVAFVDQGAMFIDQTVRKWEAKGKVYGEDFVDLGYIVGGETAMSAFARDIRGLVSKDTRGHSLDSLPIMQGTNSASDFKLGVHSITGVPGVEEWARQFYVPYQIRSIHVVNANSITRIYPYLQSGQTHGMLGSLKGAAELEKLASKPGPALAGMDAQSLAHYVLVLLMVLGNIKYWGDKKSKSQPGRGA